MIELNEEQQRALDAMMPGKNVFLVLVRQSFQGEPPWKKQH
jgi:hypothetical protein